MIGLTVNGVDRTARNLSEAKRDLPSATQRGVAKSTLLARRELTKQMTGPKKSHPFWGVQSSSKEHLTVRSGLTRASLTPGTRVFVSGDTVTGAVGSSQKHLLDHESGGTFPGKSPKGYARIPTAAMQTPGGVDRLSGASIRSIPAAFLFTSKTGKLWAAIKGRGKELVLLYLLVKSVTLPARRIFGRVTDRIRPEVNRNLGSEVTTLVRKANS